MGNYSKTVTVTGKSAQDLYQFVSKELENFLNTTPLSGHKIEYRPNDLAIDYSSSMAKFTLTCVHEALKLEGKLAFLAMPFRSKLDAAIERWIQKHMK